MFPACALSLNLGSLSCMCLFWHAIFMLVCMRRVGKSIRSRHMRLACILARFLACVVLAFVLAYIFILV
jgi:hypothetical protein